MVGIPNLFEYEQEPQPRSPFGERRDELFAENIPFALSLLDAVFPEVLRSVIQPSAEVSAHEEQARSSAEPQAAALESTETAPPAAETAPPVEPAVQEQAAAPRHGTAQQDEDRQSDIAAALAELEKVQWN